MHLSEFSIRDWSGHRQVHHHLIHKICNMILWSYLLKVPMNTNVTCTALCACRYKTFHMPTQQTIHSLSLIKWVTPSDEVEGEGLWPGRSTWGWCRDRHRSQRAEQLPGHSRPQFHFHSKGFLCLITYCFTEFAAMTCTALPTQRFFWKQ